MSNLMPVVRIQRLSRIVDSPLKKELVYFGEAISNKLHMEMLDNGIEVKLAFLHPIRPPNGRVILPKSVYQ